MIKKVLSIILIIILMINLVLFGLGLINDLVFWAIIILGAIIAYSKKIIDKIHSKN
jgi:hypothetical protein